MIIEIEHAEVQKASVAMFILCLCLILIDGWGGNYWNDRVYEKSVLI